MTDTGDATPTPERGAADRGAADRGAADRRVRTGLRVLVDEMMEQLRHAAATDAWTDEERARAEADLVRIMTQVRAETFRSPDGG